MSELLVTQCPYCQTRFRLSQQHLAAAAGNVRCGACLKVFNASLTPLPEENPPPAASAPSTAPAQPADQPVTPAPRQGTLLIHDDLDFDELDLEALGLDESLIDEVNPRELREPEPGAPLSISEEQLLADAGAPTGEPDETRPLRDMDEEFDLELDPLADAAGLLAAEAQEDPLQDLHEDFIASP
ncbi:MJ0042-type zinc finger domain-containing protein, partial [Pseudomonas sp.]|uniref:MJ0042-type zinc finger domain-containing protein n=1 Tax=Pseudomonas sp. TaxID=306 RepID=UPI00272C13A9